MPLRSPQLWTSWPSASPTPHHARTHAPIILRGVDHSRASASSGSEDEGPTGRPPSDSPARHQPPRVGAGHGPTILTAQAADRDSQAKTLGQVARFGATLCSSTPLRPKCCCSSKRLKRQAPSPQRRASIRHGRRSHSHAIPVFVWGITNELYRGSMGMILSPMASLEAILRDKGRAVQRLRRPVVVHLKTV